MFHLLDELGFSSEESWLLGKPKLASGLGFAVDQYSVPIDELSARVRHRSFGSSLDPSIMMNDLPPLDEWHDPALTGWGWNIRISNLSIERNQRIFCLSTQYKPTYEIGGCFQAWMIQDQGDHFHELRCEHLGGNQQVVVGVLAKGTLIETVK